jgi:hypothetical protein
MVGRAVLTARCRRALSRTRRAFGPPVPPRLSALGAVAASVLPLLLLLAAAPSTDASTPRRAAPAAATRPGAAAIEAARRFLCPHGGAPVRGPRGRGRCRGGGGTGAGSAGDEAAVRGWDAGLPPPVRTQAPCPEGTVAAEALARPEARRCLPR